MTEVFYLYLILPSNLMLSKFFFCFYSADRHKICFREQMKALLVCLVCSLLVHLTSSSAKPNIVLFLVDDLGIGDVPCFGKNRFFFHSISPIFPFLSLSWGFSVCLHLFTCFLHLEPLDFLKFPFFEIFCHYRYSLCPEFIVTFHCFFNFAVIFYYFLLFNFSLLIDLFASLFSKTHSFLFFRPF